MTNHEAITKLTNIMHDDHYAWHPSILTAFGMAVDALKAQLSREDTTSDCISRTEAIKVLCEAGCGSEYCGISCDDVKAIEDLPSAQPERTCVNCGRTVNNGGWYADGRTRCPIEEHYALPKDGYCHLWEKRNFTDDDYPERREE